MSRRGGRNKGGRKQMRANPNKRRQTQTNASKRRGENASKREQTWTNASKRLHPPFLRFFTPPFIAVFYTPLCNPLKTFFSVFCFSRSLYSFNRARSTSPVRKRFRQFWFRLHVPTVPASSSSSVSFLGLQTPPTCYKSLSGPSGPKCPQECPRFGGVFKGVSPRGVSGPKGLGLRSIQKVFRECPQLSAAISAAYG